MASHGLRLLGLSFKEGESLGVLNELQSSKDVTNPAYKYLMKSANVSDIEKDQTFLGFVCIKDPLKEEVKESIELA